MKALMVVTQYPSEGDLYKNGFVHSRVKTSVRYGMEVEVYVYNNRIKQSRSYYFEGIKVTVVNADGLKLKVKKDDYDVILIHFAWKKMTNIILENKKTEKKMIVWVHGAEALNWKRRLFNLSFDFYSVALFGKYILHNIRQMFFYKKLIRNHKENNIHFVFVSKWMKKITEIDTKNVGKITNFSIIPNPVDTSIFYYQTKVPKDRLKIFNLRPYTSNKYANDITVEVILELSKKEYFSELEFNLYGDGRLFEDITGKLRHLKNVNITKGFFKQNEIKEMHNQNGIILIPTRQDAQGVSMCEAICSGLVPITSDNTAIPEFVNSSYGYLCNSIGDYVNAIEELYYNAELFVNKSFNTRILSSRLGKKEIEKKEWELIKALSN